MLDPSNIDILKTLENIRPGALDYPQDWGADPINNEPARLGALYGFKILDTDFEEDFDHITRWASRYFAVPVALISLLDKERVWFKSAHGLSTHEVPRDIALCNFSITSRRPVVVEDTLCDERFMNNPLVTGHPNIRFYAGAPMVTDDGYAIGSVCLVDYQPHEFLPLHEVVLSVLADIAMAEITKRGTHHIDVPHTPAVFGFMPG